jgi:hypothetical protein
MATTDTSRARSASFSNTRAGQIVASDDDVLPLSEGKLTRHLSSLVRQVRQEHYRTTWIRLIAETVSRIASTSPCRHTTFLLCGWGLSLPSDAASQESHNWKLICYCRFFWPYGNSLGRAAAAFTWLTWIAVSIMMSKLDISTGFHSAPPGRKLTIECSFSRLYDRAILHFFVIPDMLDSRPQATLLWGWLLTWAIANRSAPMQSHTIWNENTRDHA